jgi:hypothetical protein
MYSFDSSVFIELERFYPKDQNTKLWDIISNRMKDRTILISREVIEELNELGEWIDNDYPEAIIESTDNIQNIVSYLVNKYYNNDLTSLRIDNSVDPFVIAVAKEFNVSVVSLERINKTIVENPQLIYNPNLIPKIPNICHIEGIKHLDLISFLVEIGNFN